MVRVGVVIAAGGRGTRLGGKVPKQFLPLEGLPILERTVKIFSRLPSVEEIVVATPRKHVRRAEKLLAGMGSGKVISVVPGGRERQDSVWEGLRAFLSKPTIVLIHDAVRPLVEPGVVTSAIVSAARYGAAVVAVKSHDTVKVEGKKGYLQKTLDRSRLWAVQTPQAFRYEVLVEGHRRAKRRGFHGTDDASLVERMGLPVRIVEGRPMNIKITTPADLRLAEMWLKERRKRPLRR